MATDVNDNSWEPGPGDDDDDRRLVKDAHNGTGRGSGPSSATTQKDSSTSSSKTRSAVHLEFGDAKVYNKATKQLVDGCVCLHCPQKFTGRVVTNLRRHLQSCHKDIADKVKGIHCFILRVFFANIM